MKIGKLFVLFLFFSISGNAQSTYPDSLRQALKMAKNDSARYHFSYLLSSYYQEDKWDSAVYFIDKSLVISRENKNWLDVAYSLDSKGYSLMHMGNLPQSLQCFLEAVKIAEDPKNENKTIYKKTGDHVRIFRLSILANIHHDWGHLMRRINVDEGIFHYKRTEKIAMEIMDTVMLGFVNMNMGRVYFERGSLDSALVMEHVAERIFTKATDKRYLGFVYHNLGEIYMIKNDLEKGLKYFRKSVDISLKFNNFNSLNYAYYLISEHFLKEKIRDSSLFYARKGLEGYQAMGSDDLEMGYTLLYKNYKLSNTTDSVLKYQELALLSKDSTNKKNVENLTELQKSSFAEQQRLQLLEQEKELSENRMRNYGMFGILFVFFGVGILLYRNNKREQKAKQKIEKAYDDLKSTQSQLIQSEKMASLGELTAGIAHEIQNPLNFVNNFSEVSNELLVEMKEELEKGNLEDVKAITDDVQHNLEKILHHGKRADAIVKGMLQHSRSSSGKKEPADINVLADEYLRLAYHGLRAKDKSFNSKMETDFDQTIGKINVIPQDIGRVILNLITNAFYVVDEKKKSGLANYDPMVSVSTKKLGDKIEISVKDNGNGIPEKVLAKIFQPFFTTKPTGQGTGLGLSLSYDIVKAHGGDLSVETKEGEGTAFKIILFEKEA
jgi:signal transduction histidine kinase